MKLVIDARDLIIRRVFQVNQAVACVVDGAQEFIHLQVHGRIVFILRVLHQKHHRKRGKGTAAFRRAEELPLLLSGCKISLYMVYYSYATNNCGTT